MQANSIEINDKAQFRRQYPRRSLAVPVGVLAAGKYALAQTGEIGEGGMSFSSEYVYDIGSDLVLSFQIPKGGFVFVRGSVRSAQKDNQGHMVYGLAFLDIQFAARRQIRAYVSARTATKKS